MIPIIQPHFGPEEQAALVEVLRSGWVAQGPKVAEFEAALAPVVGAEHAVVVSSATAGLHLALHVAGVGQGDDVIVPSLSFIATTNAAWMVGARPVFADVAPDLPVVSVASVAAVWTPNTKAVIAVHQLGIPFDRQGLRDLCEQRGAVLIEDAACAIGSLHWKKPIAADAALAVFSFHPRKILTTGEGGAVVTNSPQFAERLRRLRQHGMTLAADQRHGGAQREQYLEPGWNYRMTDLQAALGLVQLGRLPAILEKRRQLAARYDEMLADLPGVALIWPRECDHWNVQTYCICLAPDPGKGYAERRDRVLKGLNDKGIGARRGVLAAHLEPAWSSDAQPPLPYSEAWAAQSLALPLYHAMTEAEQLEVVARLRELL